MLGLSVSAVKDVAERALRTAAQAFLGVYGLDLANVLSTDLAEKGLAAAASAALAVLMGLVATKAGSSSDDASVR
jgi:hypothetical protein